MLLDHFLADRKPQAGTSGMCRESRLEDLFHFFSGHADALVFKIDLHPWPIRRRGPGHVRHQPAAGRHGTERVEREIQENLLQTVGIRMHQHFSSVVVEPYLHASLTRERTEKLDGLTQQPVQVRGDWLGTRLAMKLKDVIDRGRERAQPR